MMFGTTRQTFTCMRDMTKSDLALSTAQVILTTGSSLQVRSASILLPHEPLCFFMFSVRRALQIVSAVSKE